MQLLTITFNLPLSRKDIAGFRAAIARAAGYEEDLFHNHQEDGRVMYRYPLIQYRSVRGKAGVVALNEGVDSLGKWVVGSAQRLHWNHQDHDLTVAHIAAREYPLNMLAHPNTYLLTQWLPLNDHRYREWQELENLSERLVLLEKMLVAHILTFCRAVNWRLPERLELHITQIRNTRSTRFLGNTLIGFDLEFQCNLQLPEGIGLGKGVSHGFGVCRPLRTPKK